MSLPWSNTEVQLIVADYFNMLSAELKGESYSKAVHRRALKPLLQNRSEGSVEFKHQNISAVLMELGQPFIKGYLPRVNYQHSLRDVVIEYLNLHRTIENQFQTFADKEILKPSNQIDFLKFIIEPPKSKAVFEPSAPAYRKSPIKVNYLEREQRNRNLGQLGEELVIEYEKWQLKKMGKTNLSSQIVWISQEEGDGAGYDILSRNPDGTKKYIEVKTTKLSKETPIFFSKNELDFSVDYHEDFHLYRLFDFEMNARMFKRNGALNEVCFPVPVAYKGFF
ncbi:DUF3883 domain-containing protein [uncultured Draconibacterium sp.]|uniref:DUF3883 domain-containing protein n=1 Tax=uncultured Draconibacterium sp. TaxID=1573823 RepID=UPI0029C94354|nr:DUF3883 domain-containing protein [uncultured Draconibacterium sp.]